MRRKLANCLDDRLRHKLKPLEATELTSSAVIFAPHPDDETLGCGGIAYKKIKSGAAVRFVFVTNGIASHSGRIDGPSLKRQREAEAIEAVARLGGSADHVTFLGFPDGAAMDHVASIADAAQRLLRAWAPQSVYVPHRADRPADHAATRQGVLAALARHDRRVTVFEYPVWCWYHWPWVSLRDDLPGMWRTSARQTLLMLAGLRLLPTLNTKFWIGDALAPKRHALAAHVSQMTRPEGRDDWPILADLSAGDFLARFLNEYETFFRYEPRVSQA
jgi:LmbE family N-acetylglucosaminyl deacetylase